MIHADELVKRESAKRTRRSFLVAAAAAAAGYGFYRYVDLAPGDELLQKPLRDALDINAKLSEAVFREHALSPTYPVSMANQLRVNGNYGLKRDVILDSYRLQVVGVADAKQYPQYVPDVTTWDYKYAAEKAKYEGHDTKEAPKAEGSANAGSAKEMSKGAADGADVKAPKTGPPDGGAHSFGPGAKPAEGPQPDILPAFQKAMDQYREAHKNKPERGQEESGESDSTLDPGTPGLLLTLGDLAKLPQHELVTQFKCIEGWSEIVQWAGIPMRDFLKAFPPARNAQGELPRYVYMETPNGDYYCGFNLRECEHPQSTLVTEMSGKPLEQLHGAPLRLHMPIKYGYKQIKRIGLIAYTDDKPDDYWTKLGYDWYAGL